MGDGKKKSEPLMVSRQRVGDVFLGLKPKTLANKTSMGKGPQAYKVGGLVFYRVKEIEEYLIANPIFGDSL